MSVMQKCPLVITIIISVQLIGHYVDAAVNVRLVNGTTKYEGRVEVYHAGQWGTVCDDGWRRSAAQVVCNELGFGPAISVRYKAFYGEGSGQIWLDNVICVGTESTIGSCLHSGWGVHDCDHNEDVGVKCSSPGAPSRTSPLNDEEEEEDDGQSTGALVGEIIGGIVAFIISLCCFIGIICCICYFCTCGCICCDP